MSNVLSDIKVTILTIVFKYRVMMMKAFCITPVQLKYMTLVEARQLANFKGKTSLAHQQHQEVDSL